MDFLKKLEMLKSVVQDNPPDALAILELITKLANDVLEIKERLEKLEKEVG